MDKIIDHAMYPESFHSWLIFVLVSEIKFNRIALFFAILSKIQNLTYEKYLFRII